MCRMLLEVIADEDEVDLMHLSKGCKIERIEKIPDEYQERGGGEDRWESGEIGRGVSRIDLVQAV